MPKLAEKKSTETDCKLCPKFTQTFMMFGKKWNGLIIEVLLEEPTLRFKDIANAITKCSDRVLCERLKELEDEQIVVRNTYPDSSRVDYALTERGRELAPVMKAVHDWSDKWC